MTQLILAADTVHTLGPAGPTVTALAMSDGIITHVGSRDDIASWRSQGDEVIDLGAATITPGLTDSHSHPIMGITGTAGVQLSSATTLDEARVLLAEHAASTDAVWVRGWGLDPNIFGERTIDGAVFDDLLGGRPLCAVLFDGHSGLVNPRALEIAGITRARHFEKGGQIVVDAQGAPTGLLLEMEALQLILAAMPAQTPTEVAASLLGILERMAQAGLTGAHAMDFAGEPTALLNAIEEQRDLPLRLRFSPICNPGVSTGELERFASLQGAHGRHWAVEGIKLFMDGTIDNGTAWLAAPDNRGESTASVWPDPDAYSAAVRFFAGRGIPTATHAIGDQAVRHALATLAALTTEERRAPHRVEHAETMPDDLIADFVRSGAFASMQPGHCTHYTKADHSDNWSTRLGDLRADRAWRIRDLVDAGVTVALGSDWPVADFDPRGIFADARLRRTAGHPEETPNHPEQAISALDTLRGFTINAARAAGHADTAGSLEVGKLADVTAFSIDPLAADPDELAASPIPLTLVGGRVQHRLV